MNEFAIVSIIRRADFTLFRQQLQNYYSDLKFGNFVTSFPSETVWKIVEELSETGNFNDIGYTVAGKHSFHSLGSGVFIEMRVPDLKYSFQILLSNHLQGIYCPIQDYVTVQIDSENFYQLNDYSLVKKVILDLLGNIGSVFAFLQQRNLWTESYLTSKKVIFPENGISFYKKFVSDVMVFDKLYFRDWIVDFNKLDVYEIVENQVQFGLFTRRAFGDISNFGEIESVTSTSHFTALRRYFRQKSN